MVIVSPLRKVKYKCRKGIYILTSNSFWLTLSHTSSLCFRLGSQKLPCIFYVIEISRIEYYFSAKDTKKYLYTIEPPRVNPNINSKNNLLHNLAHLMKQFYSIRLIIRQSQSKIEVCILRYI